MQITNESADFKGVNVDNVNLIQIEPIRYDQYIWITKRIVQLDDWVRIVVFQTDYFVPLDLRPLLENKITVGIKIKSIAIWSSNLNTAIILRYQYMFLMLFPIILIFSLLFHKNPLWCNLNLLPNNIPVIICHRWSQHICTDPKMDKGNRKTFLCSYMVFSMIGIWNLLLLYNFILIQFLPAFTKIALDTFCITFFSESSLISQIQMFK